MYIFFCPRENLPSFGSTVKSQFFFVIKVEVHPIETKEIVSGDQSCCRFPRTPVDSIVLGTSKSFLPSAIRRIQMLLLHEISQVMASGRRG